MLKTRPQLEIKIAPAPEPQPGVPANVTATLNLGKLKEILAAIQEIKKHRPDLFQP